MITERELLQAIDECQQEPITGSKRGALADLFIIYDHLFGEPFVGGYSNENQAEKPQIETASGTEFLDAVSEKPVYDVMLILDELMSTIGILHPTMYNQVLRRIEDL